MTDGALAVAEVAKTTGEIVKAAGGVGAYLAQVVGSIPENLLGLMVGDWLDHKRRRHLAELEEGTARHLEGIATERLTEPSPSVLIPLLQSAVDEGRPELQDLWAALLANAMVDGGKRVRRDYFEAVRQMEPPDAVYLEIMDRHVGPSNETSDMEAIAREATERGLSSNERSIAVAKLQQLGCVAPNPRFLMAFGRGLVDACRVV